MNEQKEKSISLRDAFILLRRHLAVILLAGLLCGIAAFSICRFFVAPVYEANAKMIVNSRQEQSGNVTNDQITSAQKLVDTYAIIIRSQPVLDPVIRSLELPMSVEKLAKEVTVTSVNETQVMEISVQSTNPTQALQIVESIVATCPRVIIEVVEAGSVKTIEPARLKSQPVAPHTNLYTVVVAMLSMLAVFAFVLIRFTLDNTYKSENDLWNDLELPVLGVIPNYHNCTIHAHYKEEYRYGIAWEN